MLERGAPHGRGAVTMPVAGEQQLCTGDVRSETPNLVRVRVTVRVRVRVRVTATVRVTVTVTVRVTVTLTVKVTV